MRSLFLISWFLLSVACSGSDAPDTFTTQDARGRCSTGGTTLLLNGEEVALLCSGADGANGVDGLDGLNGRDGVNGERGSIGSTGPAGREGQAGTVGPAGSSQGPLVVEAGLCSFSRDFPFLEITYQYASFSDGSLYAALDCDTNQDQDSMGRLFPAENANGRVVAISMRCALSDSDANNAILRIESLVNIDTRTFSGVDGNGAALFNLGLDTSCSVMTAN